MRVREKCDVEMVGPSRDVLVLFFFFLRVIIIISPLNYYLVRQRSRGRREAHDKGNGGGATRFDFERARARRSTFRPGQGRRGYSISFPFFFSAIFHSYRFQSDRRRIRSTAFVLPAVR